MGGVRNSPSSLPAPSQLFPAVPLCSLPSQAPDHCPQPGVQLVCPLFPCSPHCFSQPETLGASWGLSFLILCPVPSPLSLLKVLWDPVLHQVRITHSISFPCITFQPPPPPSWQNHPAQASTPCISLSQSE